MPEPGIVPGLLLGLALILLCLFIAYRDGHPRGAAVPMREAVKITVDALWGHITIFILIGGILAGVFTAIEAGAVACLWAFCVTMFIYRDLHWRNLPDSCTGHSRRAYLPARGAVCSSSPSCCFQNLAWPVVP